MLRIRDVYPGSDFFPSRIPDPNCLHPGSRIRIKEFKYFNPKKPKKWFLSSWKYDPGCSSRIPDPDADFLPILDPRSRGQKGTGSRIRIRITDKQIKNVFICIWVKEEEAGAGLMTTMMRSGPARSRRRPRASPSSKTTASTTVLPTWVVEMPPPYRVSRAAGRLILMVDAMWGRSQQRPNHQPSQNRRGSRLCPAERYGTVPILRDWFLVTFRTYWCSCAVPVSSLEHTVLGYELHRLWKRRILFFCKLGIRTLLVVHSVDSCGQMETEKCTVQYSVLRGFSKPVEINIQYVC